MDAIKTDQDAARETHAIAVRPQNGLVAGSLRTVSTPNGVI
jgi:hypothetical protein